MAAAKRSPKQPLPADAAGSACARRIFRRQSVALFSRRWSRSAAATEPASPCTTTSTAAASAGAAGVHLPSGSSPKSARARLPGGLIGASAHSVEEAAALLTAGADYVTVSPIFVTASKPGYGPALGLDGLARVVERASGPVIALGGITAQNAARCCAAGAQGIAVMGEVMRAADPQAATAEILSAIAGR